MDKFTPLIPKYFHISDKSPMERFRFVPQINTKSVIKEDGIALLEVEYKLECRFEDILKEPVVFASVIMQFEIEKDYERELDHKSQTVFNCVKIVENKFTAFLGNKKHKMKLSAIGILPITFEIWVKGNPYRNSAGFLN